jgi:hypothetical protein
MIFNPLFWFYGEVAAIYISEAFASSCVGFLCLLAISEKNNHLYLHLSAYVLGLMGGFRPTVTILLLPLWLLSSISHTKIWRILIWDLLIIGMGVLTWYIPTAILAGGINAYQTSSAGLSGQGLEKIQIFFGGIFTYYLANSSNLIVWISYSLGPLGLVFLPIKSYIVFKQKRIRMIVKNQKVYYLMTWILPPFLFYAFIFLDKPGYLLTFFPALCIATAWSMQSLLSKSALKIAFMTLNIIICTLWFIMPSHDDGNVPILQYPTYVFPKPPKSVYTWDLSYRRIALVDSRLKLLKEALNTSGNLRTEITPNNTVFISRSTRPDWRQLSFYFPPYLNLWLVDQEDSGLKNFGAEAYISQEEKTWSASGLPFWIEGLRPTHLDIALPPSTRYILWFLPEKSYFYVYLSEKDLFDGRISLSEINENIPYTKVISGSKIKAGVFTIYVE